MLTVTDSAGGHLAQMLVTANASDDVAIRLVDEKGKTMPKLDQVRSSDTRFEHAGKTVLVLDGAMSHALSDHTLDVQDIRNRQQLVLLDTQ